MPGADARLDVFTDGLERRLTNLNEFEPVARRGIEMMVVTVDRLTVLDCPCRPGYPRQRALLVFRPNPARQAWQSLSREVPTGPEN